MILKALMMTDASGLILLSVGQLLIFTAIFADYERSKILMAFSLFVTVIGLIFAFASTFYYKI